MRGSNPDKFADRQKDAAKARQEQLDKVRAKMAEVAAKKPQLDAERAKIAAERAKRITLRRHFRAEVQPIRFGWRLTKASSLAGRPMRVTRPARSGRNSFIGG